MNGEASRGWIEAAKILAVDPTQIVRCPVLDDGVLQVLDAPLPEGPGLERYLTCSVCGARNIILMRAGVPRRE